MTRTRTSVRAGTRSPSHRTHARWVTTSTVQIASRSFAGSVPSGTNSVRHWSPGPAMSYTSPAVEGALLWADRGRGDEDLDAGDRRGLGGGQPRGVDRRAGDDGVGGEQEQDEREHGVMIRTRPRSDPGPLALTGAGIRTYRITVRWRITCFC